MNAKTSLWFLWLLKLIVVGAATTAAAIHCHSIGGVSLLILGPTWGAAIASVFFVVVKNLSIQGMVEEQCRTPTALRSAIGHTLLYILFFCPAVFSALWWDALVGISTAILILFSMSAVVNVLSSLVGQPDIPEDAVQVQHTR